MLDRRNFEPIVSTDRIDDAFLHDARLVRAAHVFMFRTSLLFQTSSWFRTRLKAAKIERATAVLRVGLW